MLKTLVLSVLCALLVATAARADRFSAGEDVYLSGSDADGTEQAARDLFAAGFGVRVGAPVGADAHLAGFSVTVSEPVEGNLYAVGSSLRLAAPIGADATVAGFSVETESEGRIDGNARLSGGTVRVGGPVAGALVLSGGDVTLDAPVSGDVWIAAGSLRFESGARIDGTLRYAAPSRVEVPDTVIAASDVTYVPLDVGEGRETAERWTRDMPTPGPFAFVAGVATTLGFLLVLGTVLIAFMPVTVQALRQRAAGRPGLSLLMGVLGLSALFGLVPVSALTIVGLPLIPLVLLALVLAWTLGYLLGVYSVAMRVVDAFREGTAPQGMAVRVLALLAGLVVAVLLNFVPFLGWMLNVAVVLLGLGAITAALGEALLRGRPGAGRV
ncbi:hypothetical protein [Tranquillimonas rosea]|uniref:hypothetical protein n=1 Tax=Tranquillimonas rosea TaxID=641238 RepID=UPI003BAA54C9